MAFPNRNFNVDVQNISALSCGSPHTYSCFHNRVNGLKISKTVRDMNVCEDVMKDFFSIVTSEPIQAILPRQSVHMPVPSKCLGLGFHFKCVDSTGIFYIFTFFFNVFSGI